MRYPEKPAWNHRLQHRGQQLFVYIQQLSAGRRCRDQSYFRAIDIYSEIDSGIYGWRHRAIKIGLFTHRVFNCTEPCSRFSVAWVTGTASLRNIATRFSNPFSQRRKIAETGWVWLCRGKLWNGTVARFAFGVVSARIEVVLRSESRSRAEVFWCDVRHKRSCAT